MMIKTDIERQILLETRELSPELLSEILDFIQFLKMKYVERRSPAATPHTEEPSALNKVDILTLIPQHNVGEVKSSLRREEIYGDAR